MADDSKVNIYISSKNRRVDESVSNFNVIIPDGLLKLNKDELFELSVISFCCSNSFYHCNNNTNKFQIIFRNNIGNLYMVGDYLFNNGNPNVYDILRNLNTLSSVYMTTSYNRINNKFTFTRTYAQSTNYFNMYIKPINSGTFLGLTDNIEYLIPLAGVDCKFPIDIITIKNICIGISGDIGFRYNNMESSSTANIYKPSDLLLVKSVNVNKNELIIYENIDGGESFRFDLGTKSTIKYFVLSVYDQDGNTINDMSEYSLSLQFIIRKKDQSKDLLARLIDYNKESYFILGHIFDLVNKMFNYFTKLISK